MLNQNNMEQDNLSIYGTSYQVKAASLLLDASYLSRIQDVIRPSFFTSDALQWIVKHTLKHFKEHRCPPSIEMFNVYLAQSQVVDSLKVVIERSLKDVIGAMTSPDRPAIFESLEKFAMNCELRDALIECVDHLKSGQFEKIRRRIDKALRPAAGRDLGLFLKDDLSIIFEEALRRTISTPWDVINDLVQGGFGGGELIVFVAGPGGGKSMSLVNVAAHAMKQGKNVIYYTLELKRAYVAMRFCSYFTGIQTSDLQHHMNDVMQILNDQPGNIVIKHYDSGTATLSTIDSHIQQLITDGFKPDMILIDYADLLNIERDKKFRADQDLGNLYVDMRGMAGKYDLPIFTASQANRSSAEQDVIHGGQIASSYEKLMVADFVISLARKTTDKIAGTGRWHIIKSRFGPDGLTFPSKMNMTTCKIFIFNGDTEEGKEASKEAARGEQVIRANLKSKFQEMMDAKKSSGN